MTEKLRGEAVRERGSRREREKKRDVTKVIEASELIKNGLIKQRVHPNIDTIQSTAHSKLKTK